MASRAFLTELQENLPILFVYIGWASRYDGTESVRGRHRFLQVHPDDNSEIRAFYREDRIFTCGIGPGMVGERRLHVVFVARDPTDDVRKAVGIYAAAVPSIRPESGGWHDATTRNALRIPAGIRPSVMAWAGDTGVRRWALRRDSGGVTHPDLLREYRRIKALSEQGFSRRGASLTDDQTYADLPMAEGKLRLQLVAHRAREARLRDAKIRQVLDQGEALVCQVPGCGFDFEKKYGPLGRGFAHVHHLRPLATAGARSRKTRLKDLVIACANCHADDSSGRGMPGLQNASPPEKEVTSCFCWRGRTTHS